MNEKFLVDNGQQFDFGKASEKYAKYRDIYPEELFQRLHEIGVGVKDSNWLDLGTGTGVVPCGMAKFGAHIVATDISRSQINGSWNGASASIKDLKTHYFDDPHMDTMIVELPFTRETWHGRMMASRGVMASMNKVEIEQFDYRHRKMLEEKYPEEFTVKHKIFLTWYVL